MGKIGHNNPCPCGSGNKYKRCCMQLAPDAQEASLPCTDMFQVAIEHHRAGRLVEAESGYREVLAVQPGHANALYGLGVLAQRSGKIEVAIALIESAIRANPGNAGYHTDLGNLLLGQGASDEALECYSKAVVLKPDSAEAQNNLGAALYRLGRQEEAVGCFRRALELKPDYAEAHYNLGLTLHAHGSLNEAAASFTRAVASKPEYAEAHYNLGVTEQARGRLEEAVACYTKSIALKPGDARAYNNLGVALQLLGNGDKVYACFQKALSLQPDFAEARSNFLSVHAYRHDLPPASERALAEDWEKHTLTENDRRSAQTQRFAFLPRSAGRLRLGILSAELREHTVAYFLEPVLEELDRSRFEVTLYPTVVRLGPRAEHFRELAEQWIPLAGIPDGKAAERIRSDRIDVLIDTTSHTSNGRLGILARRAAPVQCHYIGYYGTTGLAEMDWFLADENLLPVDCDDHFREKIWRLPRLWLAYRGDRSLPESRWKPDDRGILWLGSFNSVEKVGQDTCRLWSKVMHTLPESKLLLKDSGSAADLARKQIQSELALHGIAGDRIEFARRTPDWYAHMSMYDQVDIALDTIPLNSGTTAFDALWMGVPLVSLEGGWMGGRMSSTILRALGRHEWVARSEEEYAAIVAGLARDQEGRGALRAGQRSLMASSPLCDAKALTRALEDAFEAMYGKWAADSEMAHRQESDAS